MPEPGMGANNDHGSSSVGSTGGSSASNESSTSSSDTTADSISNSDTTADGLSGKSSDSIGDAPTTAEALASSPTTAESLASAPTHGYDEVPSVEVSIDTPVATTDPTSSDANKSNSTSQLPDGVPNEYADLFGETPNPVGGVDAVWSNGDGTYSSSDGTTYDPSTGKGTYDAGEDSFAVTKTSIGVTPQGDLVSVTERSRHPDRVRASESLALVAHDPKGIAKAHGNRVAFDYYNNPNMDGIREEALMHAANRAGAPVTGRYPGENLAYIGIMPLTAHLARSLRNLRTSGVTPVNVTRVSVDDKLARYLLNKDHPIGGPKANWFDKALGFSQKNADDLAKQVTFDEKTAVKTSLTEHGQKYNQVISIQGANGKTIDVTFGWIRNNDGDVKLTTAIPTKK